MNKSLPNLEFLGTVVSCDRLSGWWTSAHVCNLRWWIWTLFCDDMCIRDGKCRKQRFVPHIVRWKSIQVCCDCEVCAVNFGPQFSGFNFSTKLWSNWVFCLVICVLYNFVCRSKFESAFLMWECLWSHDVRSEEVFKFWYNFQRGHGTVIILYHFIIATGIWSRK